MKTDHSIRDLFILLLVIFPLNWFVFIFPYKTATEFFTSLPNLVNSTLIEQYPEDLVINVKAGQVELNRKVPYCLTLKESGKMGLVFDTSSPPKVDAFEVTGSYKNLCQPIAVVGKDFYMYLEKQQIKISKISTNATFTVDKPSITSFVNKYLPMVTSFGIKAYYLLPFIFVLPAYLFLLLNNLWYSFISRLLLKPFKVGQGVKTSEVYNVTLFFYTIINIIQWVIVSDIANQLLKQNLVISFPFMNTIIIAIATVIYYKNKSPNTPTQTSITIPPGQLSEPKTSFRINDSFKLGLSFSSIKT